MAKKARRRLEEDDEYTSFQFPEFDVPAFLQREFEQEIAMWIAVGLSALLGVVAYVVDFLNLPLVLSAVIGVAAIAFSPLLIQRLRPPSKNYTRGEWAGLIMLEIFGWLAIWFLLLNTLPH